MHDTRTHTTWKSHLARLPAPTLLAVTSVALVSGIVASSLGRPSVADVCWAVGTVVSLIPAVGWVVVSLLQRTAGVDLIAVLALLGTLTVGEYLAGALIGFMLATGRTLESAAERRASRDLRALLERAPQRAHKRIGENVVLVPLDDVEPTDLLVVASGEVVPVDGVVADRPAVLDESALTGESLHVERRVGESVRSGVVNVGSTIELRATANAADSTYSGIVRLAQAAANDKAPIVRIADRFAVWFLPLTLLVSSLAWWLSGSAVRAVAVLVVATPCPLLLAAPVAIVSGLSRASRIGVVIRGGGALETLGRAQTLVMDKTGTLTTGRPSGLDVATAPGHTPDEVLQLAAAVDQLSPHVLAESIVHFAKARGCALPLPTDVSEQAGTGVSGIVNGRAVKVGADHGVLPDWAEGVSTRSALDGAAVAWVQVDGTLVGAILLRDPLRRDAPRTLRRLRAAGLDRLIMLTGDRRAPALEIGSIVGLDAVLAEQTPVDKVAAVQEEKRRAVTIMVGDGINDAPALAAASVGVAMGARGATASSEAADIVLTTDHLARVADAMEIARRSRRIAVQSAGIGMTLSLLAMVAAAVGWIAPAPGALLQEGIDVAVILNALRALRGGRSRELAVNRETGLLLQRFDREHDDLRGALALIRDAAEQMSAETGPDALAAVRRAHTVLVERVLPHERAEETQLYPALADAFGTVEATAPMSRAHAEIDRLIRRLDTHLGTAEAHGGVQPDQRNDLLACLYGLYAVLRLHFAQEEEDYFALAPRVEDEH
ncbi:cadmium-translocating P-type ATPase [Rhodococcus sp. ACS1]|uniref:Heavy metal-(Cd/Co/Hg/Pb/Zn)-translocating P-type ATPase n=1 Tax=Rhodococcus koreensis TaxID=99653 RepID=A0A1H5EWG8_9NOCA|nr:MULTISPECIES: heavy metal translocating P-type ATPase [Rhodococcus]PBC40064.1 cadmium-translocating P-type ATPase [Rhodococcus sp. ACS1]SED95451.1 heavy metal-(Cd/Co/Hg/Pb/Zn)-translocating P-type ATPase [Rhodococcus koreensis]